MKVIRYSRTANVADHIYAREYATCFYIPDENIIIGYSKSDFGSSKPFLNDNASMMDREAKVIAAGEKPQGDKVSFCEVI